LKNFNFALLFRREKNIIFIQSSHDQLLSGFLGKINSSSETKSFKTQKCKSKPKHVNIFSSVLLNFETCFFQNYIKGETESKTSETIFQY